MTLRETVSVSSAEIKGATAYEVSGMTMFLHSFPYFLVYFSELLQLQFPDLACGMDELLFLFFGGIEVSFVAYRFLFWLELINFGTCDVVSIIT